MSWKNNEYKNEYEIAKLVNAYLHRTRKNEKIKIYACIKEMQYLCNNH